MEQLHHEGVREARLYGHDPHDGIGGSGAFFLLLDDPEVYGASRLASGAATTLEILDRLPRTKLAGEGAAAVLGPSDFEHQPLTNHQLRQLERPRVPLNPKARSPFQPSERDDRRGRLRRRAGYLNPVDGLNALKAVPLRRTDQPRES